MRRDPFTEWHNPVREAIKERDCLTRFSVAQHPMTRYPGFTVQEVRDAVERDLLRLRAVGGKSTAAARSGR